MKKSVALPSKYITGEEVGNHKMHLIVSGVFMETMENGKETKPVMHFGGKERGMVVNSGNWDAMAIVWGDESDNWTGKTVELFTLPTQFGGKNMLGCRIRAIVDPPAQVAAPSPPPLPAGPGEQAAAQAQQTVSQSMPTDRTDLDDDIPF